MIQYSDSDKLKIIKLLMVLKILSNAKCKEDINILFKKNPNNSNHKSDSTADNLSDNETAPIKDDSKYIPKVQDVTIEVNTEITPSLEYITIMHECEIMIPIQDLSLENESNFIPPLVYDNIETLTTILPVIVAEVNIDIPIEATFKLKTPALDIKTMKKDLYITSSTILPLYENYDVSSSLNGKLFLEGFIRSRLDFSIAKSVNDNIINLDTESVVIYIPFKGSTLIQYKAPPVFSKEKPLNAFISCTTHPIQCEIKEYKICETLTLLDKESFNKDFPVEIVFRAIKEDIVVNLSITLLQKQDVNIEPIPYNNNFI